MFFNHQLICGYKFVMPLIDKVSTLYGAFLINGVAKKRAILNNRRDNLAGYVGFNMGELRKRGDYSFDINFQYVQPQAIPDFDFAGIGKGNSDNIGLYTTNYDGTGGATTSSTAVGKANYLGGQVEVLYLFSSNLTISQSFKISQSLDKLPSKYRYKQYRAEFIYAW